MTRKRRSVRRRERRLRIAIIGAAIFAIASLALVARYVLSPKGDDFFNAAEKVLL